MRITNFRLIETRGKSALDTEYIAEVDVQEGAMFWKKQRTRKVRREYAGLWHFVDSGEFTPLFIVETLARAWTAQTGQKT
ncbi:hypothetical protein [Sphingomonas sp.]|jgi:hypothetical protein|uniref:hypothetical protein n=1 Tax=Sphingomonas sp. TaxID=28214 RepID=UPI0035637337